MKIFLALLIVPFLRCVDYNPEINNLKKPIIVVAVGTSSIVLRGADNKMITVHENVTAVILCNAYKAGDTLK